MLTKIIFHLICSTLPSSKKIKFHLHSSCLIILVLECFHSFYLLLRTVLENGTEYIFLFFFFFLFSFYLFPNFFQLITCSQPSILFFDIIQWEKCSLQIFYFFFSFSFFSFFIFYEISENWKIAWVINYGNFCMKLEKIHFKIICSVIKKK